MAAMKARDDRDSDLESLLQFVRTSRGFDLTAYKRATLTRRIGKRLSELGLSSFAEYRDYVDTTRGSGAVPDSPHLGPQTRQKRRRFSTGASAKRTRNTWMLLHQPTSSCGRSNFRIPA